MRGRQMIVKLASKGTTSRYLIQKLFQETTTASIRLALLINDWCLDMYKFAHGKQPMERNGQGLVDNSWFEKYWKLNSVICNMVTECTSIDYNRICMLVWK